MTAQADSGHAEPTVSVFMITYNHEAYIAQAIEGVLAQQTEFSYRLVIGEDRSSDRTAAICRDYAARFPERIVLLARDRNLGAFPNVRETFAHCRGRYIAMCEGDDYWTDPGKLQKQVAAMERNPAWSACCHRAQVLVEGGNGPPTVFPAGTMPAEIPFERLCQGNLMHTCSLLYRGGLVPAIPEWFVELPMNDWPLHLLHAAHGPIGFLDEVMSVYRVHPGGMWSTLSETARVDLSLKAMFILEAHLPEPQRSILVRQRREMIDYWRGTHENTRKIEARYRALGLHHVAAFGKWCKDRLRRS